MSKTKYVLVVNYDYLSWHAFAAALFGYW